MLLVSKPTVGAREKAALSKVVDSGWITMGERVRAFELAFAQAHEMADSVAVSSCTAALHLIVHALGIGPGDEVLVPSMTFVATSNAVLYTGATPVFVDIESPDMPVMSIQDAEAKSNSRTKAVILMHYAGYLVNRDAWRDFARRRNLLIIEDAAHAAGHPLAGSFGIAAAFSFYGNKNMTTAEGGAILSNDPGLLERTRQMRGHGMTSGTHQRVTSRTPDYDVTMLGFNYRLDEFRGAVGLVQVRQLRKWNNARARLSALYRSLIAERCPWLTVPFTARTPSAHHIMPIVLPRTSHRQFVIDELRRQEIQTTVHYPPVHRLSFYRSLVPALRLPHTEDFARRELTVPLHPQMNAGSVAAVVDALAAAAAPHHPIQEVG